MDKVNKDMCVALIGPLPPPFGGMANQTRQLQGLLENEGVNVLFVQTNAPYSSEWIGKLVGIRAAFRLIPYLTKLWRAAGEADCMHVMANSGWSWQLFAAPAVWMGWLRKCPVVVNYRGGEAQQYLTNSIKWVRPTLSRVNTLVVPSGFLQNIFADFSFSAQVIPNIVNLQQFKPRSHVGVRNNQSPHIVITRNLEAIYGLKTAVEAIAILQKSIPNVQVSIAGSGPQLNELIQLIEAKKLQPNITLTGKLTPQEVAVLYAEADVMLNPTTVDNMPNSVLEAMGCGLPVVTTNVGGIPYIVTDNQTALLVEPNNPEIMAARLLQLFEDPQLYKKLAENGLKEVERYTWQNVKQQWLGLYNQMVTM